MEQGIDGDRGLCMRGALRTCRFDARKIILDERIAQLHPWCEPHLGCIVFACEQDIDREPLETSKAMKM